MLSAASRTKVVSTLMSLLCLIIAMPTTTTVSAALTYPSAVEGGQCGDPARCPCRSRLSSNGTRVARTIRMRFHPPQNPLPPHSFFTAASKVASSGAVETVAVAIGRPMPPIVLQFWDANATDNGYGCTSSSTAPWVTPGASGAVPFVNAETSLDGTGVFVSNATITTFTESGVAPFLNWSFTNNISFATNGEIVLYNFTIYGPEGAEVFFRLNTSVGLWLITPMLLLYQNLTFVDHTLSIVETGANPISTLPCFCTPFATLDVPIPGDVLLVVQDLGGYPVDMFDGQTVTLSAQFQDPGSGSLTVNASTINRVVNGGFVTVSNVVVSAVPSDTGGAPSFLSPFQIMFTLGSLTPVTSAWITLLSAPVTPFALQFSRESYVQDGNWEQKAQQALFLTATSGLVSAVVGLPMRRVVVEVISSSGIVDEMASGFFVTATSNGASLRGNSAMVLSGVAIFDNLIFSAVPTTISRGLDHNFVITFSATTVLKRVPLYSQRVVVRTQADTWWPQVFSLQLASNVRNQLKPINDAYQVPYPGVTWPLPTVVDVLLPNGLIDPAANCTMIASGPLLPAVNTSLVAGRATFPQIQLQSFASNATPVSSTSIMFSCVVVLPSTVVFNATSNTSKTIPNILTLASLQVSPILLISSAAVTMRFEPSVLNVLGTARKGLSAAHGVALPLISIELVGLDQGVVREIDDVVIIASSASLADVMITGSTAVVRRGRAVFSSLTLFCVDSQDGGCVTELLFKAFASTSTLGSAIDGMVLSSGLVSVTQTVIQRYALKAVVGSLLEYDGQSLQVPLAFAIPPVGVGVYSSDNQLDLSVLNVRIRASITSGSLNGTLVAPVVNGMAWLSNLTIAAMMNPLEPKLVLCAEVDPTARSAAALAQSSPVIGKCIASKAVTFQLPVQPVQLMLSSSISPLSEPLIETKLSAGALFVNKTNSTVLFSPAVNAFEARIFIVNGAQRIALPPVTQQRSRNVVLETSLSTQNFSSSFLDDTRPSTYPSSPFAVFRDVQFTTGADEQAPVPVILGMTHTITFTSEWLPSKPLRVGTLVSTFNTTEVESIAPVICVTVGFTPDTFVLDSWISLLSATLRIDSAQIEVLRVRETGTASSGSVATWRATLVELRMLPPMDRSFSTSSALELTNQFLVNTPVCVEHDLRIMFKFLRRTAANELPYCDVYWLAEQSLGAQACFSQTGQLCACMDTIFKILPSSCYSLDLVGSLCSNMKQCISADIVAGCQAYQNNLTIQYILIGVYVLLAMLLILAFYVWKKELIQKCLRDTVGNRNRRDIEYSGLQIYRGPNERVDPSETLA